MYKKIKNMKLQIAHITLKADGEVAEKSSTLAINGTESNLSLVRQAKKVFGLEGVKGATNNLGTCIQFSPWDRDDRILIKFVGRNPAF